MIAPVLSSKELYMTQQPEMFHFLPQGPQSEAHS